MYLLHPCTGVGLIITCSTWKNTFKIAEQLFRHFLGRESSFYMRLTDADEGWWGMMRDDFDASEGWLTVVSGGLQGTHSVEWFNGAVVAWSSEGWPPLSWRECCIHLTQRIHLRIHKQSIEQVIVHKLVAMLCLMYIRRLAVVAVWLISSSRQVAKVISLKCILWFVYELAQRQAWWEVTWLFHWSSERVIFSLCTFWLNFSMCLVFI